MRRCVADFGFILTLAAGLRATAVPPPDSPWRTMRTGKAAPAPGGKPSCAKTIDAGGVAGLWRLAPSVTETAETEEASILHTADIERSGQRLAGLMLPCRKRWIEAVVGLVEPLSAARTAGITLPPPGQVYEFIGTIIPTGAGIRLPGDATNLVMPLADGA